MRLTTAERQTIVAHVAAVFGAEAKPRLFGSRVDDSLRGGDIDLFVDGVALTALQVRERRIDLLLRLHEVLGERKIDVVVQRIDGPELPIHREARRNGVEL